MNSLDLGTRIRSVFYLILGIVFSFVFILISYHIELNEKLVSKNGELTLKFLVESLEARERYLYEDFSIGNYQSISYRLQSFLKEKGINNYHLTIFNEAGCAFGDRSDCDRFQRYVHKSKDNSIFYTNALDSLFIRVPINLWNSRSNYIGIEIKSSEIFHRQTFFEVIIYRLLPFFVVVFLVICFYVRAEKRIINPAIEKILQLESLKIQKNILRQFTHDIRSPLLVIADMFNLNYENDKEVSTLLKSSVSRVLEMSNEFLSDKSLSIISVDINQLVKEIIAEKIIQFRNLNPQINFESRLENSYVNINKVEFSRSLSNLLNNSLESNNQNLPKIDLLIFKIEDILQVHISDNGQGISSENLRLIEHGNFSTKSDGSGLGILGVKKWLSQINGSFSIKSQLGYGTIVELQIPELK